MSQQIKNIKEQLQEAFANVDSSEFLHEQIIKSKDIFSKDFLVYMKNNPKSNFREWNEKLTGAFNIHSTVSSELQAIGISLLALDALEHDITEAYIYLKRKGEID